MAQWASTFVGSQRFQHRWFQISVSVLIGLAFFVLASWGLHRPTVSQVSRAPGASTTAPSPDSLTLSIPENKVAVSAPVFGAGAMINQVQVGDRMDIVGLFPARGDTPAQASVVIRGAMVLAVPPAQSGAPIVFAVSPEESLVVTHLVQTGVSFTYSLWSTSGAPPPPSRS